MATTAERINALIEEAGYTAVVTYDAHLVGDKSGIRLAMVTFGGAVTVHLTRSHGTSHGTLRLNISWCSGGGSWMAEVADLERHTDASKKALSFAQHLGKLVFKATEEAYEPPKVVKLTFDPFGRKMHADIRRAGLKVGTLEREYHREAPGGYRETMSGRFLYCYRAKLYGMNGQDVWGDTFYSEDHDARAALTECRVEARAHAYLIDHPRRNNR